jgi:GMP synthase (glutamine-hydrolysing)
MKIHIIMHESFESPGAIVTWAQTNNHTITYTHLYKNEILPKNTDNFDYLIIMGGPQSPATTLDECPHFNATEIIKFIKKAINNDKFILGICLGAQLIGEALDAKFNHSPNREIGVFELTLTNEAKNDPIFSTFPSKFSVGHWHGDMPGLTKDAKILAYSEGCPRQILKYASKIYGFQCHFEFTHESIEEMINNNAQELIDYKSLPYVENASMLRKHTYSDINSLLFKFLSTQQKTPPTQPNSNY